MIDKIVIEEINAFLRFKAPGLTLTVQDNPAFNSTTLGIGVKIDLTRLISNDVPTTKVGEVVVEMIAEVQKAAVTAIGMELYIRERELAVLARLQERINTGYIDGKPSYGDPLEEAYRELGGKPPTEEE